MSKRNYSQYSNKKNDKPSVVGDVVSYENEPVQEPQTAVDVVVEPVVSAPAPEVKMEPKTVKGVVFGCSKLNVRAKPNTDADVVCILDTKTEITINVDKSNAEWFCICTAAGVKGYCMRKFVDAEL